MYFLTDRHFASNLKMGLLSLSLNLETQYAGCQLDFVKKKVFLKGLIVKKKGFCNKKKVFRAKWIAF